MKLFFCRLLAILIGFAGGLSRHVSRRKHSRYRPLWFEGLCARLPLACDLTPGSVSVSPEGDFCVIGTENADQVFAIQTGTNTFHAKVNGVYTPILTATGAMVIHGLGGDDYLKTLVSTRPSRIYGGEGNDELWGFIAPDLLDGGNGNDSLYPRSGRDVVVGGDGVDRFGTIDSGDVIFHNRLATINGEDDAAKEEFRALWVSDPAGALAILDMLIVNEDDEDRERILGLPGTIFAGANDY